MCGVDDLSVTDVEGNVVDRLSACVRITGSPGWIWSREISLPFAAWSLEVRPVVTPKCSKIRIVNPEQSAPFVKLVPPYTYGLPKNCFAYATIAVRTAEL